MQKMWQIVSWSLHLQSNQLYYLILLDIIFIVRMLLIQYILVVNSILEAFYIEILADKIININYFSNKPLNINVLIVDYLIFVWM